MTGNQTQTFTHSLGITPSLLVVRPIIHQAALTITNFGVVVQTVGTNIATIGISGAGTAVTVDCEVEGNRRASLAA